jgi:aldose 1-epimerase
VERLSISAGESVCTLCPAIGGSLASWHIGKQAMLRTVTAPIGPLDMASFPLVPYSNRIAAASFEWAGQPISLTKNFLPEPHAIHGVGWKRGWAVEQHSADHITVALNHDADDDWPWPFTARQMVTVTAHQLTLDLSVQNLADCAVPLGFGHHPYFDKAGASLRFDADEVWMSGEDCLPTSPQPLRGDFDFRTETRVAGRSIDHGYSGTAGGAHIEWEGRPLALDIISPLPAAVVYVPEGGHAFCFEPVPHIINALNLPGAEPAMPIVASGASYQTSILFRAVPR